MNKINKNNKLKSLILEIVRDTFAGCTARRIHEKTVFHPISKHLKFHQKYSTMRRICNSFLVVWKCDESLFLVFNTSKLTFSLVNIANSSTYWALTCCSVSYSSTSLSSSSLQQKVRIINLLDFSLVAYWVGNVYMYLLTGQLHTSYIMFIYPRIYRVAECS